MKEREMILEPRPVEVVADAMMVAVYEQIKQDGEPIQGENLKEILTRVTKNKCRSSSAYVLFYLEEKYPQMFPIKLLVEAIDPYRLLLKQGWSWHDYFLVLGKDNHWYSGSPANFGKPESEERTTNLIYGRSLAVVMEQIRTLEGGQWPEVGEIYKLINEEENLGVKIFGEKEDRKIDLLLVSREMVATTSCRRISMKI